MPLGAIAGGLATGLAGSLLGGGDSGGTATSSVPFTPTVVSGGLGSATAVPSLPGVAAQVVTQLSPEMQAIQNALIGQAGTYFGTPATVSPYLTGAGTAASQAAQGAFGALNTFDPYQAASQQYALQQQLLQPTQQQEQLALEERLYQQGLLGGTAGSQQQQALYEAQNLANLQSMLDAQTMAMQQQQNLASLGTTAGAFGGQMAALPYQLQGAQLGLGTTALGAAMAPEELAMKQAELAKMVQPSNYTYQTSPGATETIGAGLLSAGSDQLTSGLQGLFSSSTPTTEQALAWAPWNS